MFRRLSIVTILTLSVSACAPQPKPVVMTKLPPADQTLVKQPTQPADIMASFNNGQVSIYPLDKPAQNPFDYKKLQPLSEKVIGEGYPVLDPSVTVYPLALPTAMPQANFDNVQMGAAANLYSAKVQSAAQQRPPEPVPYPPQASDMAQGSVGKESLAPMPGVIGMDQTEVGQPSALPPITTPPINVSGPQPVAPTPPATAARPFTPAGTRSQPVAGTYGAKPVIAQPLPPVTQQPAPVEASVPAPAPMAPLPAPSNIPTVSKQTMLPVADTTPLPPIGKVSTMPMTAGGESADEGDTIPMPPIPSLTGY